MSVPITLQEGQVLIYGRGTLEGFSGLQAENQIVKFGTIYQIWDGGEVFIYGGQSVFFNEKDVICRLAYNNYPYTLIEVAKLAGSEIIPV